MRNGVLSLSSSQGSDGSHLPLKGVCGLSRHFSGPRLGGSAPSLGSKEGRKQQKNNALSDSRARHLCHRKADPRKYLPRQFGGNLTIPSHSQKGILGRAAKRPCSLSLFAQAKEALDSVMYPNHAQHSESSRALRRKRYFRLQQFAYWHDEVLITGATKWPGSTKLTSSLTNVCGHLPPHSQPRVRSPFFSFSLPSNRIHLL